VRLTVTSLLQLSQCGEQYRQRYIQKIRTAPNYSLILGRAVDSTVMLDLKYKIKTGKLLNVDEITDLTRAAVEDIILQDGIMLTQDEVAKGMSRVRAELTREAVMLAHIHHTHVAPRLEPTQVQREFEVDIAGHTITGRMDIQEGSRSIRDLKVTGRTPPSDDAERSLQLTVYAMACAQLDGRIPDRLYLDYLVHTAKPSIVKLETTRGRHQFYAVEERVKAAAAAIEAGNFVPAGPDSWYCSERFCPFFMGCKYV
jgi:PD-(D/E)XK nuclease superfamily